MVPDNIEIGPIEIDRPEKQIRIINCPQLATLIESAVAAGVDRILCLGALLSGLCEPLIRAILLAMELYCRAKWELRRVRTIQPPVAELSIDMSSPDISVENGV